LAVGTYHLSLLVNPTPATPWTYTALQEAPFYPTYAIWEAQIEIVEGTPFSASLLPAKTAYEESVLPGTIGYSDVIFLKSELEGTGINISDISTIKGKLRIYDKTKTTPQLVQEKEFTYTRK
jgi:hypothetical protein